MLVRTDIPFGNACDVDVSFDGGVPVISVAADPHGGPETLWFCFRIEDDGPSPFSGQVRLVVKHMQNMLGGARPETFRPVMRVGEADWNRLGPGRRLDLPDGRWSGEWTLDIPKFPVDIALCYPYGPSELDLLVSDSDGYWQADTIGVSQNSRPVVRLSNDYGEPGASRPGVYLVARQHSGETPGSWVLDGLLRHMAENKGRAPLVWAVPLVNIDGVVQGDYGKDNFPHDLNRAWGTPPMRHEVLVISRDIRRWRSRCDPRLGMDFHAPGGSETEGVYSFPGRSSKNASVLRNTLGWAEHLGAALSDEYSDAEFVHIGNYPSRWATPGFSSYMVEEIEIPGMCVETLYASVRDRVLDVSEYREIGRRFAEGIMDRLSARRPRRRTKRGD